MTDGLFEKYKDKITITGHIADEDLETLYRKSALFLYPSLYEGFGLPPLEAMRLGVPVIVADNSSLPEVCGDAAIYVSGFSETETADAIRKILEDKITTARMQEKGLAQAALFSFDKMVDQMMQKIRELVERDGADR
jgi:glycosyltransferase involved in cell wall biosynthesis